MTRPDNHERATPPPGESRDPAAEPLPPTSKPVGDAIPTPPEPGLDAPLPPKTRPEDDQPGNP